MATLLQVRNLTTQFFTSSGIVRAVDNVSFDVEEGETVAVVGESGCGKSLSALSVVGLVPWPPGTPTVTRPCVTCWQRDLAGATHLT